MTMPPPPRFGRPSCRVGCIVAALLVTLGGLRLLAAGEPAPVPAASARGAAATVANAPWPAAVPADVFAARAADVTAAVEDQANRMECVPGACGFPRVVTLPEVAREWSALRARVASVRLPSEGERLHPEPTQWFAAPICPGRHPCPSRLEVPAALVLRF